MGCIVLGLENSGCLQEGHTLGPRLVPTRALECAQALVLPHTVAGEVTEGRRDSSALLRGKRVPAGSTVPLCVYVCVRVCT